MTRENRDERWSARRSLFFMIIAAAAFWAGLICGALLLQRVAAHEQPPPAWVEINRQVNDVNRSTAPLSPRGDPDGVFDCEDYAWTKYDALRAIGVPADHMRLYALTTWRGARHMILVVDGWVFDNLFWRLRPIDEARRDYPGAWDDRSPGAPIHIDMRQDRDH